MQTAAAFGATSVNTETDLTQLQSGYETFTQKADLLRQTVIEHTDEIEEKLDQTQTYFVNQRVIIGQQFLAFASQRCQELLFSHSSFIISFTFIIQERSCV